MAEINHEIKIKAPISKVYQAINTLKGLHAWHSSHIQGEPALNAILTFEGKDKPTFKWKVIKADKDHEIVWECVEGPGESLGTKAIYKLSDTGDGRTLVKFSHTGWPSNHENFNKCNTLWGILLHHLKNYVEAGKTEPAFV